jgi:hypothetical protein
LIIGVRHRHPEADEHVVAQTHRGSLANRPWDAQQRRQRRALLATPGEREREQQNKSAGAFHRM